MTQIRMIKTICKTFEPMGYDLVIRAFDIQTCFVFRYSNLELIFSC